MRALDNALFDKLTGDTAPGVGVVALATGGIFRRRPQGSGYPAVEYFKASGVDAYTYKNRSHRRVVYGVKTVELGLSSEVGELIYERVDSLLTDGTLDVEGWELLYIRKALDISEEEIDGDQHYQHTGAQYEILVAEA